MQNLATLDVGHDIKFCQVLIHNARLGLRERNGRHPAMAAVEAVQCIHVKQCVSEHILAVRLMLVYASDIPSTVLVPAGCVGRLLVECLS